MLSHAVLLATGQTERTCLQCRTPGLHPSVGKIPWRRQWQRFPVFLPGEVHGRRSRPATVHGVTRSQTQLNVSAAAAKSLQSCPTLCDPIDDSPPGSPIPGILQARILEWVAILCGNSICEFLRNLHTVFHD